MSLEDQPRSGRPSTSRTDENIAKILELILEDRHRTTDDLVDLSGVLEFLPTDFEPEIAN